MKIALAQLNPTVGDLAGNAAKILAAYQRGVAAEVALVVCPELSLTGYPPRDLLLKKLFLAQNLKALGRLTAATGPTGLLVGYVGENSDRPGRPVTNSVALLQHGKIVATRSKTLLPTYDVFDEDRYFQPAAENLPVEFNGQKIALTICEDIWNDADFWPDRRYQRNPPVELAAAGAEIIFNLSASPWHVGKNQTRREMLHSLALKTKRPVVFCNQAGGNDELIFDGDSLVFNADGEMIAQGKLFAEDFIVVDLIGAPASGPARTGLPAKRAGSEISAPTLPCEEDLIYRALVLGLRDYLHKCGFKSAVLGLSGGIDSAITAVLAAEALGKENVRGISLPSQFSSQHSLDDARILAERLGIHYDVVPIQPAFATVKQTLQPLFAGRAEDTTEENIQARLRAVMLMALSNKFGSLLLTTGNKSELAVGYCTLYGDMCGGLAVISDVPKMMIYQLARWLNRDREIIPAATIEKPPSAELRPNQRDQDTLPPYEILDPILEHLIEDGLSPEEIAARGFDAATVRWVVKRVAQNEYKRAQAVPGLKVTSKAFGVGRKRPVAQRFAE